MAFEMAIAVSWIEPFFERAVEVYAVGLDLDIVLGRNYAGETSVFGCYFNPIIFGYGVVA